MSCHGRVRSSGARAGERPPTESGSHRDRRRVTFHHAPNRAEEPTSRPWRWLSRRHPLLSTLVSFSFSSPLVSRSRASSRQRTSRQRPAEASEDARAHGAVRLRGGAAASPGPQDQRQGQRYALFSPRPTVPPPWRFE